MTRAYNYSDYEYYIEYNTPYEYNILKILRSKRDYNIHDKTLCKRHALKLISLDLLGLGAPDTTNLTTNVLFTTQRTTYAEIVFPQCVHNIFSYFRHCHSYDFCRHQVANKFSLALFPEI